MTQTHLAPIKFVRTPLVGKGKPQCRAILPSTNGARTEPALFEWELRGETWTDWHPHTEYNFVIEGQLFVESAGVTVEALAGDVVCIPAGTAGCYWAPSYARLLAVYGPTEGQPSRMLDYACLDPAPGSAEPDNR